MRRVVHALVPILVLLSCTSSQTTRVNGSNVAALLASSAPLSAHATDRPVYGSYREGVIGSGQPALLFFSSQKELFSQQTHGRLTAVYSSTLFPIPTYRVDIETNPELKRRYMVLSEDTVVLVDSDGNKVASMIHPSEADLKDLLNRYSILR